MEDEAQRRTMGQRIRTARKRAKLSQIALGRALGVSQSVVSDWETGELVSWQDYLPDLCRVLDTEPNYFAAPDGTPLTQPLGVAQVQVVGLVQGGAYRMAFEVPATERKTVEVAVAQYQAYHVPKLRALKVVGDSVDELYPDGTHVIVVPADETYVGSGDKVVVFRRQGELREATIKELRFVEGKWVLYPRSTNPEYQPIVLADEDQDGFEIAYVVVGCSRTEERPPPPVSWSPRKG